MFGSPTYVLELYDKSIHKTLCIYYQYSMRYQLIIYFMCISAIKRINVDFRFKINYFCYN